MIKLSFQNNLGKALLDIRQSKRLIQADIAERSGLSIPTIRLLELGRGNLISWNKVLSVLGITLVGRNLPPGDSIGSQVAKLRKRRGLGQRSLASIVHTTQPTIVALERSSSGRLDVLDRILTVLGAGAYLLPVDEKRPFFTHAGNSSTNHTWRTPGWLLQNLYNVFGEFDLDPCSPNKTKANASVRARIYYTEADDGLSLPWFGTVFVNPPYGKSLRLWTSKAQDEVLIGNANTVVGLIPSRTDTTWWHQDIASSATIFFLRGRLSFGDGNQAAPFPSALAIWGASASIATKLHHAFPKAWCPTFQPT